MNIVFYSYKGGVGRSQALVNIGLELLRRGRNVCLIDVDLEAPGLHHILGITPEPHQSLINHLIVRDMSILGSRVIQVESIRGRPISDCLPGAQAGSLSFLPSVLDRKELARIGKHDILSFFDESVAYLRRTLPAEYVLLDCRTGFAQFTPLPFALERASKLFVFVARLDSQNAAGIAEMLSLIDDVPRLVVASQVPESSELVTQSSRDWHIGEFEAVISQRIDEFVPFDSRMLFGDVIPLIDSPPDSSITRAFGAIADRILALGG